MNAITQDTQEAICPQQCEHGGTCSVQGPHDVHTANGGCWWTGEAA